MRSTLVALAVLLGACDTAAPPKPVRAAWTFAELLAPPTAEEVATVDRGWPRELAVADARVAHVLEKSFAGAAAYEIRAVVHRLAGEERGGFVLVPRGSEHGSLAGLVDVRDIRWDYPTRDISRGAYVVTTILREEAARFAIMMPCLRGGTLRVDGYEVTAAGDRRDAWEGAAIDTIAFTTAALQVTPEIDPDRLAVYGYSRGGGVALLAGERDPRLRAVLAFAAPTDWFRAMTDGDGPWPERLSAAARDPDLPPDTLRNQFLDWFVRDRSDETLPELRRRLLASSPAYFVERLPKTQVHHGAADQAVPVANAIALRDAARGADSDVEVHVYPGEPHSIGADSGAHERARAFLLRTVGG